MCTGSRITNDDETCRLTGGFTTTSLVSRSDSGAGGSAEPPRGSRPTWQCNNPNGCEAPRSSLREDGRCYDCGTRRDAGERQDGRNINDNATEEEAQRDERRSRRNRRGMSILRGILRRVTPVFTGPSWEIQRMNSEYQSRMRQWEDCVESGAANCGSPPELIA